MMHEILFKIKHNGCPMNELSVRHPDLTISQWCSQRVDVFEVRGEDSEIRAALDDLKQLVEQTHGRLRCETFDGVNGTIVAMASGPKCLCSKIMKLAECPSVSDAVEKHRCLELPPIMYSGGMEHHRIVAFEEEDAKHLFKELDKLGSTEIAMKKRVTGNMARDIFTVSLSRLFSDLTDKQTTALIEALDNGYYKFPRTITVGKLAAAKGVPRTTYADHVRKAERKVLQSLAPFLRLHFTS